MVFSSTASDFENACREENTDSQQSLFLQLTRYLQIDIKVLTSLKQNDKTSSESLWKLS